MLDIDKYMNNFFKGTKDPSLRAMEYFMREYNNFQKNMRFIHIAGTNGKGSCTEMLSKILVTQGYKVGKLMSPHLIKYNERISINGENITDEEISELIEELEPKITEYNKNNDVNVTLFELETIMALLYFYRKNLDFVILETGLGGRYDCTNIISSPLVSVITSIGYDHMDLLGNDLSKIAMEKAGIIKENSNTIYFSQTPEIDKIFIDTCIAKNNKLHLITEQGENYRYDNMYQYFDYKDFKNIAINLKGKKQVQNTILCLETVKILQDLGYIIDDKNVLKALKNVKHKARLEKISDKPLIIYDGAHNEPAIINFRNSVDMYYSDFKRVYVVSILKRKDYKKIVELLLGDKEAKFIFTSGNNSPEFAEANELYNIAKKYAKETSIYEMRFEEAIEFIMNCNTEVSFIVGSFYMYKETISRIEEMQNDNVK